MSEDHAVPAYDRMGLMNCLYSAMFFLECPYVVYVSARRTFKVQTCSSFSVYVHCVFLNVVPLSYVSLRMCENIQICDVPIPKFLSIPILEINGVPILEIYRVLVPILEF